MIEKKIAESILSYRNTHKRVIALDEVVVCHVITRPPRPYPKHNNTGFFSHSKRTERVLSFRYAFILAHIFMKEHYYEKK